MAAVPSAHRNPYRTSRLGALRFRFPPGWDMERLLHRLGSLGNRGVITGARGSGKTTLLDELGRELGRRGLRPHVLRLGHAGDPNPAETLPRLSRMGARHALLLDLGEELGAVGRWRLLRAARGAAVVVAASHRPGGLPVLIELGMTTALARELLASLDPRWAHEPTDRLAALLRRHDHDLHRVLLALYDRPRC